MSTRERGRTSQFTQPVSQILTMFVVLCFVGLGAWLIYPTVSPVFLANPYLNGVILAVFAVGVFSCFWQIIQLTSSVSWIEGYVQEKAGHDYFKAPRLLVPLAALLRTRSAKMQISSSSTGSILDSIGTRMDEARDITRYIINLLIFLGLLGTFYGLATTIPGVVDTIRSLNLEDGESGVEVFGKLLDSLQTQLDGMGTAFASSLLGLAGSLVVGLLELFAGHGQNRFYREMEEWLSSITRVGFASGEGESSGFDQGVVATVLDHMVEQIDSLQELYMQSETRRAETGEKIDTLTTSLLDLTRRMDTAIDPTEALNRVADGQNQLIQVLSNSAGEGAGLDAESRGRLRSIDVQLLKILEELSVGRQETMAQIHREVQTLGQSVRAKPAAPARPSNTRTLRPKE